MATVTNNLTRIADAEGSITTYNVPSGGGTGNANTDIYLQGSQSLGRRQTTTGAASGIVIQSASARDVSAADVHVGFWFWITQYALLDDLRLVLSSTSGSSPSNFDVHFFDYVNEYPSLGGWVRGWIDVSRTPDTLGGSGLDETSLWQYGVQVSFSATPGGTSPNLIIDAGDFTNGGAALTLTGTSGVWTDFVTDDQNTTNQYGVFREIGGVYNAYAPVQLGSSTSLVFSDSGFTIVFPQQSLVSDTFMGIVVDLQNASTDITWENGSVASSGTKKGDLQVSGTSGSLQMTNMVLASLREVVLTAGVTMTGGLVSASGQITLGGATMSGASIVNSTAATALLAGSSVSSLSNVAFQSAGTGHAIEITAEGTYTLNGISFSGYAASNGSTGNEAIYVNVASGSVTINSDSALSYRTAGATVTVVAGQKTLSVTNVVSGSDVVILAAGTSTVLASNDGATNPVTSFDYSYTYAANTFVDIAVYLAGYVPYIVRNFLLPANGGSVQVAQVLDRNYTP